MRISDWSSDVCSSDLEYPERTADMSIEDDALTARLAMEPLGPIRQLGFVVRDLNQAIRAWTDIGVGPFYVARSEEHTSELQSLMRNSYAVFCLKKKITKIKIKRT